MHSLMGAIYQSQPQANGSLVKSSSEHARQGRAWLVCEASLRQSQSAWWQDNIEPEWNWTDTLHCSKSPVR